jgi:hypothetical protein
MSPAIDGNIVVLNGSIAGLLTTRCSPGTHMIITL